MSTEITKPRANHLVYQCPHCRSEVAVDPAFIGDTVNCPNDECGQPFEVEAPPAHVVCDSVENCDTENKEAIPAVDNVADTEQTLKTAHPAMFRNHPLEYFGLFLVMAGGIIGAILLAMADLWILATLSLIAGLVGFGGFAYWWVVIACTTLVVTNQRSIFRWGVISKHTNEVQHDDVRNMQVSQNVWQRIFGIGDLAISSSGQDDMEIVAKGIADPGGVSATIRSCQ